MDKRVALLDDFNCVCVKSGRVVLNVYVDKIARVLEGLTEYFDMVQVGKINASARNLTYARFQGASSARLDRAYISASLSNTIGSYNVISILFSHHFLVVCETGKEWEETNFD